jgi:hypothetical protein
MLTVKIIKPNNDETLLEAREVSRDSRGILLQTDTDTILFGRSGDMMSLDGASACADMNLAAAAQLQCSNATAYVMNRFGATVATYHL